MGLPFARPNKDLDSHASRLRRKLNGASGTACVLNVWGVGYRLVAAAALPES
jgi:DNA-binding response OmpR family regulator